MMLPTLEVVDRLTSLLSYPQSDFAASLEDCRSDACRMPKDVAAALERFASAVRGLSLAKLQELYTETFDLNASCTLNIGWHLFGERYERGMFLADLRPQLDAAGITDADDLPDYLPYLLMLMSRTRPTCARDLRSVIEPGVRKLVAALHGRRNPYEHLVSCAFAAASPGA